MYKFIIQLFRFIEFGTMVTEGMPKESRTASKFSENTFYFAIKILSSLVVLLAIAVFENAMIVPRFVVSFCPFLRFTSNGMNQDRIVVFLPWIVARSENPAP